GTGNLGLEAPGPTDVRSAFDRREVDVGPIVPHRLTRQDRVREPVRWVVLHDLLPPVEGPRAEAADGTHPARWRLALAVPVRLPDERAGPVLPPRRVRQYGEHGVRAGGRGRLGGERVLGHGVNLPALRRPLSSRFVSGRSWVG